MDSCSCSSVLCNKQACFVLRLELDKLDNAAEFCLLEIKLRNLFIFKARLTILYLKSIDEI